MYVEYIVYLFDIVYYYFIFVVYLIMYKYDLFLLVVFMEDYMDYCLSSSKIFGICFFYIIKLFSLLLFIYILHYIYSIL